FGSFEEIKGTRSEKAGKHQAAIVSCRFKRGLLEARVVFDHDERITGLWFAPPAAAVKYVWPRYVQPSTFREVEITVGAGEWELPGTLTVPKGEGPFPGVVLV